MIATAAIAHAAFLTLPRKREKEQPESARP
jgi:hypothetical protein